MSANDELWGTFAVDDHLRSRAFVAETVLFDRLVIPQPPPDDDEQYREWTQASWHPERLKQTLAPLEDLAIAVPWDKPLRAEWQTQYSSLTPSDRAALRMNLARGAALDSKYIQSTPADQPAKYVTRAVLANKLNEQADNDLYQKIRKIVSIDPAAEIEAVVGYGSYAKFHEEVPIDEMQAPNRSAADTALFVSWETVPRMAQEAYPQRRQRRGSTFRDEPVSRSLQRYCHQDALALACIDGPSGRRSCCSSRGLCASRPWHSRRRGFWGRRVPSG